MSEARKLRKKLRQIENLECAKRNLTHEEIAKCRKKEIFREALLQLLHEDNGNSSSAREINSGFTTSASVRTSEQSLSYHCQTAVIESEVSIEGNLMTTHTNNVNNSCLKEKSGFNTGTSTSTSDLSMSQQRAVTEGDISSIVDYVITTKTNNQINVEKEDVDKKKTTGSDNGSIENGSSYSIYGETELKESTTKSKSVNPAREAPEFKKPSPVESLLKKSNQRSSLWRNSGFVVDLLDSHNDVVTAVDCCDTLLVSASRDTTVKIWDLITLRELQSLGGHTGSVTDVIILSCSDTGHFGVALGLSPDDHLVLSGSTDCSLKIWSAKTGQLIKSVYMYNSITKIAFYKDLSMTLVTSDGGKLELWNIETGETVCSETAHNDAVTGLYVSDGKVYTCCAVDGEIKVFEVREKSLHCIYASEHICGVTGSSLSMRHVRSLCVKGDNVYYGDDGVNVKILAWKKGIVKKLANHKEEFGMTDAICCHDNLIFTSAYDLDNGLGYINVFDHLPEPKYLCTINNDCTGRIHDICCSKDRSGHVTICTAGVELQVWRQVPFDKKTDGIVATKFIHKLSTCLEDSEMESDVDLTDSDADHNHSGYLGHRRDSSCSQNGGWGLWCILI